MRVIITKILGISDRVDKILYDNFNEEFFRDIELIISCGDLRPDFLSFLVDATNLPLFYVHGNHDSIYKKRPPLGCENIDGKVIKFKHLTIMGLGGSIWYNGQGIQYTERQMRARIRRVLRPFFFLKKFDKVDIIVSHSPPFGIHDDTDRAHRGFKVFIDLINELKPKYFFHGHVQPCSYGDRISDFNGTKIVNVFGHFRIEV